MSRRTAVNASFDNRTSRDYSRQIELARERRKDAMERYLTAQEAYNGKQVSNLIAASISIALLVLSITSLFS